MNNKIIYFIITVLLISTIGFSQNTSTEPTIDKCVGVTCTNAEITCPDGYKASCSNSCTDGSCSTCTPSCSGHDAVVCPSVQRPSCEGELKENKDDKGCVTGYECIQAQSCPNVQRPSCDGELKENKDSNNCVTGYECVKTQTCPNVQRLECSADTFLQEIKDDKGCVTEYKCAPNPTTCPVLERPKCEGEIREKKDDKGCVINYECSSSQSCPPEPKEKPTCGPEEFLSPKYENNCLVSFFCNKQVDKTCPSIPYKKCEDGNTIPRHDNNGCVVDYYCQSTRWYCGDNLCHSPEESFFNCPNDCKQQVLDCSNVVVCSSSDGCCPKGCAPENDKDCGSIKPITDSQIPPGCKKVMDSETGFERVECEQKKCEEVSQETRLKCVESNGKPVFGKDSDGCKTFQCSFGTNDNPFSSYSVCPSQEAVRSALDKCKSLGLEGVTVGQSGCKVAKCLEKKEQICPEIATPEIKKRIEEQCSSQGLGTSKSFDPRGCPITTCGQQNQCVKDIPSEAYSRCEEDGGKQIVDKDQNGCVKFSQCVRRGDETRVSYDTVDDIPDSAELLSMAFKLEDLKIEFDKLARKTESIAEYYKSVGSEEEGRFRRVSSMFSSAKDKVDEIKTKLSERIKDLKKEDVSEIKHDIKYIKDVMLKDITYYMLTGSEDFKAEDDKECDDEFCFDRAFRVCKETIFYPEGDEGPRVEIKGLKDNNCVLFAEMSEKNGPPAGMIEGIKPPYTMECKIEKYALGIKDPEKDIFPYCTGNLVELLKQTDGGKGGPEVPGVCKADECRQECSKSKENAKKCLEYLDKYLPQEAKDGLKMIAEGKGLENFYGSSREFGQPQYQPQGYQQGQYQPQQQYYPQDNREFVPQDQYRPSGQYPQGQYQPQGQFQQEDRGFIPQEQYQPQGPQPNYQQGSQYKPEDYKSSSTEQTKEPETIKEE